jgi:hypothetical protein
MPCSTSANLGAIARGAASRSTRAQSGAPPGATPAYAAGAIGRIGCARSRYQGRSSGTTTVLAGRAVDSASSHTGQSSPVCWLTRPYDVTVTSVPRTRMS